MRAVIFDYGGVLCFHPSDDKVDALAQACGLDREAFLKVYWSHRVDYDRGDFDPPAYWRMFSKTVGRKYTPEQVDEFRRLDVHFWTVLDQRMIRWICALRASGMKVGLISNLPSDLGEHLRRQKFYEMFDHATLSYEQRCVKPDAPIYLECCRGLGVEPGQALFLDDKEPNVRGAEAVGLKSLIFENPAQLAAVLAGKAAQLALKSVPAL